MCIRDSLKGKINVPFDAHLMITDPNKYIPDFAKAGSSYILFHEEVSGNAAETIKLIRQNGCKPGMVINPGTSEETLKPYAKDLDYVLFMSVWPGFSGKSFIPDVVPKIAKFSKWASQEGDVYKRQAHVNPGTSVVFHYAGPVRIITVLIRHIGGCAVELKGQGTDLALGKIGGAH